MESTTHRWHPSKGERLTLALAILALLVPAGLFSGTVKEHENILELLRSSSLVVQGQVEDVVPPGPDRVCTARIRIEKLLKGHLQEKKLRVAQELLFPSDQRSYREGKRVLLFLVPLPEYSRWNDYRSKGVA